MHRQPSPVHPHGSLHGHYSRRRIVTDRGASDHGGSGGAAFGWRSESRAGRSRPECPSPIRLSPGMAAIRPRPGACPGSWPDAVLPTRPIRSRRAWRTSAARIANRIRTTRPASGNAPPGNVPSGNAPSGNAPSGNSPSGNVPSGNTPSGNVTDSLTAQYERRGGLGSGPLAPPGQHQQRQNHGQRQPRRQQSQRRDPGHDIVVPALQPDPTAA
jgi:hypothetical protein